MFKHESNSLFIQDDQNATTYRRKSKVFARKSFFRIAFKTLEAIAMIFQIVECFFAIFKK